MAAKRGAHGDNVNISGAWRKWHHGNVSATSWRAWLARSHIGKRRGARRVAIKHGGAAKRRNRGWRK